MLVNMVLAMLVTGVCIFTSYVVLMQVMMWLVLVFVSFGDVVVGRVYVGSCVGVCITGDGYNGGCARACCAD